MTTQRKSILLLLPVLVLLGISLYRQFTRAETVGVRLHRLLSAADAAPLGAALPLVVDQSTAAVDVHWQRLPASEPDTENFVAFGGQWHLVRHRNQPWPEQAGLVDLRATAPLLRALGALGYVNQRPRELLEATRHGLEALSDADLVMALIQADVALLDQRTELDAALRDAMLLRVRAFTGAAVTIALPDGQLLVLEPVRSPSSGSEQVAYLRCTDAAGRGRWHGTLVWPLNPKIDSRGEVPTPGAMLRAFLELGI